MSEEGKNVSKYNQYKHSLKIPFLIYGSLPEKIHTCENTPEESFTIKTSKHTACGYLLFTHCSFDTSNTRFLQKCWLHGKVLCRSKKSMQQKYQLCEKGNTAIDEEIDKEIESYNNHICKKSFMMLMKTMKIAIMIAVMKRHSTLKDFMLILQDLKMMMTVINLILELFMVMLENLIWMMITMVNLIKDYHQTYQEHMTTGQGDNCTTFYQLVYAYFKENYKLIAIDQSKQQTIDADLKEIQNINFTGNLEHAEYNNVQYYQRIQSSYRRFLTRNCQSTGNVFYEFYLIFCFGINIK